MTDDQDALRAQLRQTARAARAALAPAARAAADSAIARRFLALPPVEAAQALGLYLSLPGEVATQPIIDALRRRTSPPILGAPVVLPGRQLAIFPLPQDPDRLEHGPFGLRQPPTAGVSPLSLSALDVLVLPGLAFDRAGHRLGFGAGYYDRLLAGRKETGRPLLVALAYAVQLVPSVPSAPHDVPVDLIVTEGELIQPLKA
ncbi:MAG: 5-formyltetrahydrofolate cyclo-ligase [Chitinophagales bacterium]